MRVFVTGGTGYIGAAIVEALAARGDAAVVLSRSAERARARVGSSADRIVEGDPTEEGTWKAAVAGCDAAINLAGESIGAGRWDARRRQILHDSRIDSTRHLVEAMAAAPAESRPQALVSASGIDYYPLEPDPPRRSVADGDDEVDERAPHGSGFLSRLCVDWEAEARAAEPLGVRVVRVRTGVVVGGRGGAIDRWARAFRWFAGGPLGTGRQPISWVHLDDAVSAYLFALDTRSLSGPINLVAPAPRTNAQFARELGRSLGRPALLPTPGPVLRLALGDFADHLLHGRPAVPRALLDAGFRFRRDSPF